VHPEFGSIIHHKGGNRNIGLRSRVSEVLPVVNLLHYYYKTLTSIPLVFLLSCLSLYKMSQKPFLRSSGVREDHQSAQAIFLEIKKAIQSATKESFLVYQGIDEETGSCVERSLDEDKDVEGRNSR
jgi:hypothetical protein